MLSVTCDKHKGYKPQDEHFIEFSRQLHESYDLDPVYPVLQKYFEINNYSDEEKLFGIHVYLTYYNTYWTLLTLERYRGNFDYLKLAEADFIVNKELKFGSDRRGVRAIGLQTVLPQFQQFFGEFSGQNPLSQFFLAPLTEDGKANYALMKNLVLKVPHNGSWAGYKHIDLLTYCGGFPIECTDWWVKGRAFGGKQLVVDYELGMGEKFKLGKTLPESAEIVKRIEDFADRWTTRFQEEIGSNVTYDKSETMACKYHALYGKNYYAGHDIDKMQEEICGYDKKIDDLLYSLREQCFDKAYLGEHSGWNGVRKELKGVIQTKSRVTPKPQAKPKSEQTDGHPEVKLQPIKKERRPVQIRQPIQDVGRSKILVVDPYSYHDSKVVKKHHAAQIERMAKAGEIDMAYFPVEPFHYREAKRGATRNAVNKCVEHNIPLSIETRQVVPDWAVEALTRHRFSEIRIQMNTLDKTKWAMIHPESPEPMKLFQSFVNCFNAGVYTVLKIAPIVPFIIQPVDVFNVIDAIKNWTGIVEVCFASFGESDLEVLKRRIPEQFAQVMKYYHVIDDRYYALDSYREEFLDKLDGFTSGLKLDLRVLKEVVRDGDEVKLMSVKSKNMG